MKSRNKNITQYKPVYFLTKKEKNEYIVDLLVERQSCGQPVLIGSANINDTEELSEMLKNRGIVHEVLNAKHHERESEIIKDAGRPGMITIATNMAGRGTDIKLGGVQKEGETIEEFMSRREMVIDSGGLFVMGLQRQNNTRIDDQLRGRMGRNYDSGACQFFVSFEDDIFNVLDKSQKSAMETLIKLNNRSTSAILDYSVKRLQRSIERRLFDNRIRQFSTDSILTEKRKFYYNLRKEILYNRICHYRCLKTLIKKELSDGRASYDLITNIFNINNYDEYLEISELDNETVERLVMSKIELMRKKDFFEQNISEIRVKVLGLLDNLWMQFLTGLDLLKRTTFFIDKSNEYVRELNDRASMLFNEIFVGFYTNYLHIICKISHSSVIKA